MGKINFDEFFKKSVFFDIKQSWSEDIKNINLVRPFLIGITSFDSKCFSVFFNYFMKYYLKPQNSIHFKIQLIKIYKMV
jgi:hypothetical protein